MTWPPQQDPCTEPCCTTGPAKDPAELGVGITARGIQTYPDEGRRAWCDCTPGMVCHVCAPGSNWVRPGTYADN